MLIKTGEAARTAPVKEGKSKELGVALANRFTLATIVLTVTIFVSVLTVTFVTIATIATILLIVIIGLHNILTIIIFVTIFVIINLNCYHRHRHHHHHHHRHHQHDNYHHRSAALVRLGKDQLALQDIQLALEAGYPSELRFLL